MTMPAPVEKPVRRFTVRTKEGDYVGKAELRIVPVDTIKLDTSYQRDTSSTWVEDHRPFDSQQAGSVVLSGRSGGPYCIDGGHRIALAKADGVKSINAFVIEGLSQGDEARLFTRYQRERRNLTSWALFRADLVALDPETLAMDKVVRANGFMIGKSFATPRTITAIDSLRYIQRIGGESLLDRTLRVVGQTWVGEDKALSGQVLKGVAIFLDSASDQPVFRPATLDKVMNQVPPVKLVRLSLSVSARRGAAPAATAANLAEAIRDEYNKKVREDAEKLAPLTIGKRNRPKRTWTPGHTA